jgi:hypothetical protein
VRLHPDQGAARHANHRPDRDGRLSVMFPATRSNPVNRVAFNGPERPRDRADSRGRQRAIERAAAQLLGRGQLPAHLRARISPAPCRTPRCGTVIDESQRPVHVSHLCITHGQLEVDLALRVAGSVSSVHLGRAGLRAASREYLCDRTGDDPGPLPPAGPDADGVTQGGRRHGREAMRVLKRRISDVVYAAS